MGGWMAMEASFELYLHLNQISFALENGLASGTHRSNFKHHPMCLEW